MADGRADQGAGIVRAQAPARAHIVHPVGLVGIIARAEIDVGHAVDVDHMAHQRGGEQGSGRGAAGLRAVGQLVDEGGLRLHAPDLRGDGFALDRGKAQPQRARRAFALRKGAQESGEASCGFQLAA
jgi:hypothetical protein